MAKIRQSECCFLLSIHCTFARHESMIKVMMFFKFVNTWEQLSQGRRGHEEAAQIEHQASFVQLLIRGDKNKMDC